MKAKKLLPFNNVYKIEVEGVLVKKDIVKQIKSKPKNKISIETLFNTMTNGFSNINTRLDYIEDDIVNIKSDIVNIKTDIVNIKSDIVNVKTDIVNIKTDINIMKNTPTMRSEIIKNNIN